MITRKKSVKLHHMTLEKEQFITKATSIVKDVRLALSLSQEVMAELIGMSKKTYVQVEMGRRRLSWAESVSFCCCFKSQKIIKDTFVDDPCTLAENITSDEAKPSTGSGARSYWWVEITRGHNFFVQQNIMTGQYKILDLFGNVVLTTSSIDVIKEYVSQNIKI